MTLVSDAFDVPERLSEREFTLRPLRGTDAQSDYEAVMESQERLRAGSPSGWPRSGFTLAENLADLEKHEAEFVDRVAFAYTMVDPSEQRTLGCVYVNPSTVADADVHMWVRDSEAERLTPRLFATVDAWLRRDWPFARVNYVRQSYYPGLAPEPQR
jgi:hypothetical protein